MIDRRLDYGTYEGSRAIMLRKSSWLVLYLRARRSDDNLKGFYRRKHFESEEAEMSEREDIDLNTWPGFFSLLVLCFFASGLHWILSIALMLMLAG